MAPRILIFSTTTGSKYSFELIFNETCAPQFNGHNNSFLASVIAKEQLNFLFLHLVLTGVVVENIWYIFENNMDLLDYLWPIYDLIMGKITSNEDLALEELCQRFPLIAQKIMKHVDNKTLINFKEAGRNTNDFLENERFYWIRIIQRYNCLFGELQAKLSAKLQ